MDKYARLSLLIPKSLKKAYVDWSLENGLIPHRVTTLLIGRIVRTKAPKWLVVAHSKGISDSHTRGAKTRSKKT